MNILKLTLVSLIVPALVSTIAVAQEQQPAQQQAVTYASLDADSDGKVTLDEFKENFTPPNRQGGRTPQPDRIFGRWDADGDGNLTEEEFDNRPRRGGQGQGQRPNQ
jgi:Ca2+-binding EF-hand superfamily protein